MTADGKQKPEISVVIPVYNEEGIITSSVEDLHRALQTLEWEFEIIISERVGLTVVGLLLAYRVITVVVLPLWRARPAIQNRQAARLQPAFGIVDIQRRDAR